MLRPVKNPEDRFLTESNQASILDTIVSSSLKFVNILSFGELEGDCF